MIKAIKRYYEKKLMPPEGVTSREVSEHSLRLATAALLIETCRVDHDVAEEELKVVTEAIRDTFELSPEETEELAALAKEEARGSVAAHEFTHLINKGYSYDEKRIVVELLWRVVFADGVMDKYEEHYVRKIANLLHVSHKDFIDTKLKAREGS